jgi:hypothetical protein
MTAEKITPIEEVIPESNIVVFSPHFDDVLFMLGGYINALKGARLLHTKKFHIHILFSRSNYLARTGAGNADVSLDRIKLATGKRLLEDQDCLDELIGPFNYRYELGGEKECFARGKALLEGEMEFPHGMYEDFDDRDREIFSRMQQKIKEWSGREDTALIFPVAFKEHIDHFIVREAAMLVARTGPRAGFYFQEDKPYGGIATEEEKARTDDFIARNALCAKAYHCDPEMVIESAFRHYVSQVEDVYKTGIRNRAAFLQSRLGSSHPVDQIYVLK